MDAARSISNKLRLNPKVVDAVLNFSSQGLTPSFLVRYRRDIVGSLDEFAILNILKLQRELKSFEDKKHSLLKTLEEKNLLTSDLGSLARQARTKADLNDISVALQPYKSGKALAAVERGLRPLSDVVLKQEPLTKPLEALANDAITPESGYTSADDVLEGVRTLLTEEIARNPRVRQDVRGQFLKTARLKILETPKTKDARSNYQEFVGQTGNPSEFVGHRYFSIHKGERYKCLSTEIEADDMDIFTSLARGLIQTQDANLKFQLEAILTEAYHHYLKPAFISEIRQRLRDKSQDVVLNQLTTQYYHQLMQAPFGHKPVCSLVASSPERAILTALGIDGNLIDTTALSLVAEKRAEAEAVLKTWHQKHKVQAFAVWQNDYSQALLHLLKEIFPPSLDMPLVTRISAPEARIYALSEGANSEFSAFDDGTRVSIYAARKLMDPLSALVLIDPLQLNLGAHQHDVDQQQLVSRLNKILEVVVSRVGVDLNTASNELLRSVAGLNPTTAQAIVSLRKAGTKFVTREGLFQVPNIDGKVFEQAAGFLFVKESQNPLDKTFIHPEHYDLVAKMAESLSIKVEDFFSHPENVRKIRLTSFVSDQTGVEIIQEILQELKIPARDPRPVYEPLVFDPNIKTAENIKPGFVMKGRVVGLTDYGAFVDIGLDQNALLHRTQMPDWLTRDPVRGLKIGQIVEVKVVGIEREKGHIRLMWYEAPQRSTKFEIRNPKKEETDRSDRSDRPNRDDRRSPRPTEQRDNRGSDQRRFSDRPRHDDQRRGPGPRQHDRRDRGPDHRDNRNRGPKKSELGTLGDQFKALFGNQK